MGFKSLREAVRIRNRVIDAFERAERERDPGRRRALLTFVVAGGGFAGVELAGALNDFARGMLADHPGLGAADVRVVLVHAGERILPELSAGLGAYALERLRERGVEFALGARVKDARPGAVVLEPPRTIEAASTAWASRPRVRSAASTIGTESRSPRARTPARVVGAVETPDQRRLVWSRSLASAGVIGAVYEGCATAA